MQKKNWLCHIALQALYMEQCLLLHSTSPKCSAFCRVPLKFSTSVINPMMLFGGLEGIFSTISFPVISKIMASSNMILIFTYKAFTATTSFVRMIFYHFISSKHRAVCTKEQDKPQLGYLLFLTVSSYLLMPLSFQNELN